MKNLRWLWLTLVLTVLSIPAFAQFKGRGKAIAQGPCVPLWKACTQAGKTGKAGKECFQTLMSDGKVPGVTITIAQVNQCQSAARKPLSRETDK